MTWLDDLMQLAKYATPVPVIAAFVWALKKAGLPQQYTYLAYMGLGVAFGLLSYAGVVYPEFGKVMAFVLGGLVAGLVAAGAPALVARLRQQ
jgi:hypothetical protein